MRYRPIFLGLGSNLGNRELYLKRAIGLLEQAPQITIANISALYETQPKYYAHQPLFLNLVLEIATEFEPPALLDYCKSIEKQLGRDFTKPRNRARVIDIDILFFQAEVREENRLQIPHPGIVERRFVLQPLADIAADFAHPLSRKPVRQLLRDCPDRDSIKKIGSVQSWIN